MNHAKIAAALHALADAVLDGSEAAAEPQKRGRGKAAAEAAAPAQPPAETAPASLIEPPPPPPPPSPTVTMEQVNKAVLQVAGAKGREVNGAFVTGRSLALGILGKFGLSSTVGLPQEKWQALYDMFEEEIAALDAAAVQVSQASLV
jgi:hypothetical protein